VRPGWRGVRVACAALVVAVAVAALTTPAVGQAPCGGAEWVEVGAAAGLDFRHERGGRGDKHLPETMGAGIAWLDFDGDGWWDLYAVQSGPYPPVESSGAPNRLFRNLGRGRFEAWPVERGAGDDGYGQGVVAVDATGDGSPELYIANDGADAYYVNDGRGAFVDATVRVGLGLDGWSSAAALADADGDGDLDLYVTRYLQYDPGHEIFCGDSESGERRYCDPNLFLGETDRFYRQEPGGHFLDATAEAGLSGADGRGLGVLFVDLDGDRRADLYVANDLSINLLYRNRGDGTFEDLSLLSGAAANREGAPEAGMGLAVGDVDADGDPDLAVTNFDLETNTLYRNDGQLLFEDVAASSGFGQPSFGLLAFGLVAGDFDHDTNIDFLVGNGHIFETPRRDGIAYAQPDLLLLGDGAGRFEAPPCPALADPPTVTRALAVGDLDNDGDLDVARQTSGGPLSLLADARRASDWIGVRLVGRGLNTEAVGAVVRLETGGNPQTRWVIAGDSYQSSSDRRVLFGIGEAPEPGRIEITWPAGRRTVLEAPPAARYLVVHEPQPD